MKALNNIKSLLGNDEQKVVADGYLDLCIDSILGCAIESTLSMMETQPIEHNLRQSSIVLLSNAYIISSKSIRNDSPL